MSNMEFTVKLIPAAVKALENSAAQNGHSKTDTVNRAIQFYDFITLELMTGAKILVQRDGKTAELKVLDWDE